jgi:hypothetical protein
MEKNQVSEETNKKRLPAFYCNICGEPLYPTDHCNLETTFHCSSAEARFWDFERGSAEQLKAKEHWEQSRKEIYLNNI